VKKTALQIIYDGACPFCTRYVHLVKIRENFYVELIDARERPDLVEYYRNAGYDLDMGMIARVGDRIHYGADALTVLSLLTSRSGSWNRILAIGFRSRLVASTTYPLLRAARNIALYARGLKPLRKR